MISALEAIPFSDGELAVDNGIITGWGESCVQRCTEGGNH